MKARSTTDYIVVHCAATPPSANIGRKEIDRWHRAKGWLMIGYHKVIRRDGTVEDGRPIDVPGAHVQGYNHNSIGICLVGGVDAKGQPENNFTSAQFAALALLLREYKERWPKATIQGHRDFPKVAKACPCFDVKAWINETGVFVTKQPHVNPKPTLAKPEPAPSADTVSIPADAWVFVQVAKGDTLFGFARTYHTSPDVIEAMNPGLKPKALKVGQTIRVR